MLKILGILCYAFAVVDFGLYLLGTDITGVSWSPIVAVVAGSILMKVAKSKEEKPAAAAPGAAPAATEQTRAPIGK